MSDSKKQEQQIEANHSDFDTIDEAFKFGNIRETLQDEYDNAFISDLENKKRRNMSWYSGLRYENVLQSKAKRNVKTRNPLEIKNSDIEAFYNSPIEYKFAQDELLFIRNAGESKARQRDKSILIYNPEDKPYVNLRVLSNIPIRNNMVNIKDVISYLTSPYQFYTSGFRLLLYH